MGKRFYCEYCDKTIVSSPSMVKTHNNGLVHQKAVHEHYQKFKDPETILAEESNKKPCIRFVSNTCNFGSICKFSHYTKEQLDTLREYVAAKRKSKMDASQPSFQDLYNKLQTEKSSKQLDTDDNNTVVYDKNGLTHVFPWTYNTKFDRNGANLPPSIKRLKIEDFSDANITEWG